MIRIVQLPRQWLEALGAWRALVAVVTVVAFAWLGPQLASSADHPLDQAVLDRIHLAVPLPFGQLLTAVYQLSGVHFTPVLLLSVLIFLALKRFWADLVCLVVATGGILVIVDRWLKPLFDRARPAGSLVELSGNSFPSGHAAGAVVFYFLSCCLLSAHYPRWRTPLFVISSVWVALVWLSTLYVRAHWLTDLLGGAAVGYVWLSFCLAGFAVWERQSRLPT
jgi:membrane-associated phospholipid phosphatase